MGKQCLTKLDSNLLHACENTANGVVELLLINKDDITGVSWANPISVLTLKAGAKVSLVEGYRNSIQVVEAVRLLDGGVGMAQTVSFYIYDKMNGAKSVQSLYTGKFTVVARYRELGIYRVFGAYSPLEVTAVDSDSNADGGFWKVTLSTPEGSQGDASQRITQELYTALRAQIFA